jgi:hypothetical protein
MCAFQGQFLFKHCIQTSHPGPKEKPETQPGTKSSPGTSFQRQFSGLILVVQIVNLPQVPRGICNSYH